MAVDLSTSYLGIPLRSPLVAGASPLNLDVEFARRLDAAGVGAIVLPSLFEEEIVAEELELTRALEQGADQHPEAFGYFPAVRRLLTASDRYGAALAAVRAAVSVPVIASLNATSLGGWILEAQRLEQAGADALELNIYRVAADAALTSGQVEHADLALVAAVAEAVSIPVAVKLSPYYTAFASFAQRVASVGADGLVLFNRFYQPDVDLETRDVVPAVDLSRSADLRLPIRWIGILRSQLPLGVSLAATSGVHAGSDAVKAIAVGADVAMLTSAILQRGPEHLRRVEEEVTQWLEVHEYESVAQLRGSASRANAGDPSAFERAQYVRTLRSWPASRNTVAPSRAAAAPHG